MRPNIEVQPKHRQKSSRLAKILGKGFGRNPQGFPRCYCLPQPERFSSLLLLGFGLTSMVHHISMDIVQWRRNFICFLWKCKSCTVSSKLFLFKNLSLNELKSGMFMGTPCRLSWQCWGFLPMFRFDLDVWSHLEEIVQWRRNFVCFLWKCKSCTLSSNLLLCKNLSQDQLRSDMFTGTPCRVSWQSWGFFRCFGLTSMFDRIEMEIVQWRRNFVCFLWKCKSCSLCSSPFFREKSYILPIPVQCLMRFLWIRRFWMLFFSLKHFFLLFGLCRRNRSGTRFWHILCYLAK